MSINAFDPIYPVEGCDLTADEKSNTIKGVSGFLKKTSSATVPKQDKILILFMNADKDGLKPG